jgi:hypothetical protein
VSKYSMKKGEIDIRALKNYSTFNNIIRNIVLRSIYYIVRILCIKNYEGELLPNYLTDAQV